MKNLLKNLILVCISLSVGIALFWLAGEMTLRFLMPYENVDREAIYIKSENTVLNKELKPGYEGIYYGSPIKINSAGFRDYEYDVEKAKGAYRIVYLGDSMSFGHGMALEDTYPKVLERLLNSGTRRTGNSDKIEVLNFAVPGYNTAQEYECLRTRAINYKPDLIVLNFFLNDILSLGEAAIVDKPMAGGTPALSENLMRSLSSIKAKSYFAQYILSRIAVFARRIGIQGGYISEFRGMYEPASKRWLECQQELLNIKKLAEDNNAAVLVVIIPFLSDLNENYPLEREIEIVKNFCAANGIDSLDLFPYLRGYRADSLWINPIDGHPNKKAHAIMAGAVSEYISKQGLWP